MHQRGVDRPRGQKAAEKANDDEAGQGEPQKKVDEADKAELERSVKGFEEKAVAAARAAKSDAEHAAVVTGRVRQWEEKQDWRKAGTDASDTVNSADSAKREAKEASEAAAAAAKAVSKAVKDVSPSAKMSVDTARKAAEEASESSDEAQNLGKEAKGLARKAKEVAYRAEEAEAMVKEAKKRKTIEIDESLSKLDGKVVTFPKCNDTNALTQARIGEVSELGLDDYRLDVVGNKDVLPKRNWFEVRKDNPKTPEDKKRQWTCYLVTHAKEDTPAMEAPVLRL